MKKILFLIIVVFLVSACVPETNDVVVEKSIDRESKIPLNAIKMNPSTDAAPVKSYSDEYETPVPLAYPINTAGAEDSAFVYGNDLYFFFTPDVRVPVEKQIIDGVTGIYVSKNFGEPERVILQDKGKLSGDGCEFILGDKMWFCTVREGYTGIHWATAELINGKWSNWQVDDFDYEVGELHIYDNVLYFHSSMPGGKGGLDIWKSEWVDNKWGEPINLDNVNSEYDEGWPAVYGNELWISKNYGVWKSDKVNGEWQEPVEMFGPLAGEPTLDNKGNVYFTHHFFDDDEMLEADIYVAYKI